MKTLREILTDNCRENDIEATEENLIECLRESYNTVHRSSYRGKRWCMTYNEIKDIDGRFFRVTNFWSSGDIDDEEGAGYKFEGIDNVPEVSPANATTTVYTNRAPEADSPNANKMNEDLKLKLEKVQAVMLETGLTFVCSGKRNGDISLCFHHFGKGEAYDVEYHEEVSGDDILNVESIKKIITHDYPTLQS